MDTEKQTTTKIEAIKLKLMQKQNVDLFFCTSLLAFGSDAGPLKKSAL